MSELSSCSGAASAVLLFSSGMKVAVLPTQRSSRFAAHERRFGDTLGGGEKGDHTFFSPLPTLLSTVAAREVMYWGFTVKKYIHDVNVLF
jgi:hypothetical protein